MKFPKIKIRNPFSVSVEKKGKASIFFGGDTPIKIEKDKIDQLIELFFDKYAQYRKKANDEANENNVELSVDGYGNDKDRIYDFYQNMEVGVFGNPSNGFDGGLVPERTIVPRLSAGVEIAVAIADADNTKEVKPEVPKFVQKKPIEVFDELERVPNPVTLADLDKKIELLKKKEKLSPQMYSQYNIKAAIACIENRKKYAEFKEFYEKFPYTYSDKIQDLTEKYNLVMKPSDIFVPEFPEEAINIMDAYQEVTMKLCKKKPTFYAIATHENFKEKYKKRDPILLVQSPFGFFWQILGAWDAEMVLLQDL